MRRRLRSESPEEEVRAADDEYVDAVRDKLFPSWLFPATVVDRLELDLAASQDATPNRWEAENRSCRQDFGDDGEFESAARPPAGL